jgi:hypothetical protein
MLLSYATQNILLLNPELKSIKSKDGEDDSSGRGRSSCVFTLGRFCSPRCFPSKKTEKTDTTTDMSRSKFWVKKVV